MNKLALALTTTALLALGGCGGGNEAASNDSAASTSAENVTVPPDETSGAAGGADTLGNQLNALETENALGNQVTQNGAGNTAASGEDSAANVTSNAQ